MPKARKKSTDPLQEHLRVRKDIWNKSCSDFISKMIAFKRGLNGRGDGKTGLPPGSIKDPMPSQIGSFLSVLSGQYEKLVGEASGIIQEQASYSQKRKKPVVKPASQENNIEKYGSNYLSRFWTYLKSLPSSKEDKRFRMGMLSTAAKIYRDLNHFEDVILSRNIEDTPIAISLFMSIEYDFKSLHSLYNQYKRETERKENDQINDIKTGKLDLEKIENDMALDVNNIAGTEFSKRLRGLAEQYKYLDESKEDQEKKKIISDRIKETYLVWREKIYSLYEELYEKKPSSLPIVKIIEDINERMKTTHGDDEESGSEANEADDIVSFAGNPLTRAIQRSLHRLTPFQATSSYRLETSRILKIMRKDLNGFMNDLEDTSKELSFAGSYMERFYSSIENIKMLLKTISSAYRKQYIKDQDFSSHKGVFPSALNRIMRRDVMRDL